MRKSLLLAVCFLLVTWWALDARDARAPGAVEAETPAPPEPTVDPASGPGPRPRDGRRTSLRDPEEKPDEPSSNATEIGLEVVSTAGIPLSSIELQLPDGSWRSCDVEGGRVQPFPELAQGTLVRARGHEPRGITSDTRVVELRPDALLELVVPGEARWTHLDFGRFETALKRACAHALAGGRVALAVDARSVVDDPALSNPIPVRGTLDSGWRIVVRWNVASGTWIEERMPTEVATPRVREAMALTPSGVARGGEIHWIVSPLDGFDPSTGQYLDHRLPMAQRSWGSIEYIRESAVDGPREFVAAGGRPVLVEGAYLDSVYFVGAITADGTHLGRKVVVFDGDPVEVTLEPLGRVYGGTAIDAAGKAPLAGRSLRARFRYGGSKCADHACLWNSSDSTTIGPDGSFSARGVSKIAADPLLAWPPPTAGELRLSVAGYEEVRLRVDWQPGPDAVCDLGSIRFESTPPRLEVRDVQNGAAWSGDHLLLTGERAVAASCSEASDGSLDVWYEDPASVGPEGPLLLRDDFRLLGIRRSAATGQAAPSHDYEVALTVSAASNPGEFLAVGCTWEGISVDLGIYPAPVPRNIEVALQGPEGLEFFVGYRTTPDDTEQAMAWPLSPGTNEVEF